MDHVRHESLGGFRAHYTTRPTGLAPIYCCLIGFLSQHRCGQSREAPAGRKLPTSRVVSLPAGLPRDGLTDLHPPQRFGSASQSPSNLAGISFIRRWWAYTTIKHTATHSAGKGSGYPFWLSEAVWFLLDLRPNDQKLYGLIDSCDTHRPYKPAASRLWRRGQGKRGEGDSGLWPV
jgi:hypothetical protein